LVVAAGKIRAEYKREKTSPVTKINGKAFYDGFINRN
jgi:hypothetical protein